MIQFFPFPTIARSADAGLANTQTVKVGLSMLLFLSCSTLMFSQQKNEMGFVGKVGTYTLPSQKTDYFVDAPGYRNTYRQNAGQTYTFGLWYARQLSPYVRFSGELLYRRASVGTEEGYYSEYFDGTFKRFSNYIQKQQINENSISLPIKAHISFRKNGKTALAVGFGLSRVFSAEVLGETYFEYDGGQESTFAFPGMRSDWSQFKMEKTLTAGLYHRLDAKTSLGLEYSFEQSSQRKYLNNLPSLTLVDCICYGYYTIPPSNMNSISVSLKHNILGEKPKQ